MKRTSPPLVVVLFFLWACCSFTLPSHFENKNCPPSDIILKLENPQERIRFDLPSEGINEIVLCNLEIGKTYDFFISTEEKSCSNIPIFRLDANTNSSSQKLKATNTCHTLTVYNFCKKIPAILSVAMEGNYVKGNSTMKSAAMVPITTDTSFTVTELIEDVFIGGGCFDVSNVQLIGAAEGVGAFSNGSTSLGFDEGVILSTGNIASVSGPNAGIGEGSTNNGGSDSDLDLLTTQTVNDVAGIEFDFAPTISQIEFRFVFASEEYCEWVDSQFNDVFGFFISGPGINGPYSNGGENIALVPVTNEPISINTINDNLNTQYFVPNTADCGGVTNSTDIEFDGYTTIMMATANVIPCETYHIRLVIGDGSDTNLDSGVFLEASSFSAGGQAIITGGSIAGDGVMYEDCADGLITFTRETGDINQDLEINFTISPGGTATEGVDYAPFPTSVIIPAGQTEVTISVPVFEDNIDEGIELIIIIIDNFCSCMNSFAVLQISDVPDVIFATLPDQIVCSGQEINMVPDVSSGVPPLSYVWSTGETTDSIQPFVNETTTYGVTISDLCGLQDSAMVTIEVEDETTAFLSVSDDGEICNGNSTDIQFDFTGPGPWDLYYNLDGVLQTPILGITDSLYLLSVNQIGTFEIDQMIANGCSGAIGGSAIITETFISPSALITDVSCWGGNDGSINLTPGGNNPPFTFMWSNGDSVQNISNLPIGTYTTTVTDFSGCTGTAEFIINEPDSLTANAIGDVVNCFSPVYSSADLTVVGGTAPYIYDWSNGENVEDPDSLVLGISTVTVTDSLGCQISTSAIITEDFVSPEAMANAPDILTCDTLQVIINGNGSSTGSNFSYQWTALNGGNIVWGDSSFTPTVDAIGTYQIIVTDTSNGCTQTATVNVNENTDLPNANAGDSMTLNCIQEEVTLNGDGSNSGGNLTYEWITQNGNVVSGENTLNPIVNLEGVYQLVITDNNNGCTQIDSVNVFLDDSPPLADAGIAENLTCTTTQISLTGIGSIGNNFTYLWTTQNGNIVSDANTLNPMVDSIGTYQLLVTNTNNGCTEISTVIVEEDTSPPIANAGVQASINCFNNTTTLDGSNSSTGGFSYSWTTLDGNINSGDSTLNPTIDAIGTYTLLVTNDVTGCTMEDSTMVISTAVYPIADAGLDEILNCNITEVTLDGSNSEAGSSIIYEWSTTDGNIVSGENTINPIIDTSGTYLLLVTNTANNCTTTSQVMVSENVEPPIANAGIDGLLTCDITEFQFIGNNSSIGTNFTYEWTTQNGSIFSGQNTLNPTVIDTGVYQLIVTDNINGCTANDFAEITSNTVLPDAIASPDGVLTCVDLTTTLNANGSSIGTEFSYEWTTIDGFIISGENTFSPIVGEPGDYTLEVIDSINGCSNELTISVIENIIPPIATIDQTTSATLDCATSSVVIDGSGSQPIGDVSYEWTTTNGSILSGQNTANPEVDDAGDYILTVTDLSNGCTAVESISVVQDLTLPQVNIFNPLILTCDVTEIDLDGSSSSSGTNFTYQWTTSNGNITSGGNTLTPSINQSGTYQLTIIDLTNSCQENETITVLENTTPPIVEAGTADELNCNTLSITLDGSGSAIGNVTYEWTTVDGNITSPNNTFTSEVDATGTYILEVTNLDNGCTATDAVIVLEDNNIPVAIEYELDLPECHDDQGSIFIQAVEGGTPPYLYSTDGEIFYNGSFFTFEAGDYTLYAQDANGCEIATNFSIPELDEVYVDLPSEVTIDLGENYQIEPNTNIPNNEIANIQWTPDVNLSCTDCLNPIVERPFESQTYEVTIWSIYGCKTSARIRIIIDKSRDIYIPNAFSPNGDGENDLFMIYAGDLSQIKQVNRFMIFDRWGEVVHRVENFQPMDEGFAWDGTLRGKTMNTQVFVYWAEIEFIDGYVRLYEGDVSLMK